jgi:UDP-N-acetylmuramoylalanine--D-glutamate ligase
MARLDQAVEEARAQLSERYAILVDTTSWVDVDGSVRVEGGVLIAAQAKLYSELVGGALGLDVPRPAVLSSLDADWKGLSWKRLPEAVLLDLHRTAQGDDRQTQWTGPASLRWFADEGPRALVQLPDGTLGWVDRSCLEDIHPEADPWATIRRPAFGSSVPVSAPIASLLEPARRRLGKPYLWGGNTEAAADCSALVQDLIFGGCSVLLPKHTGDQRKMGKRVAAANISPGDLVFVRGPDQGIAHVGLALPSATADGVSVIHSCLTKNKVMEEPLETFLGRYRFTAARRPVEWGASSRGGTIRALEGKSIHVVGASGAEGTALLLYLAEHRGITGIVAHDFCPDFRSFSRSFRKANLAWDKATREDVLRRLRRLPVEFRLGDDYLRDLTSADFVLASQNWFNYPSNLPAIPDALEGGSRLLGLVDLALDLFPGTRIGVTGSNGKSTTAALISHLMAAGLRNGRRLLQGGNDREQQVALADLESSDSLDVLLWEVSNRHLRDRSVSVDIGIVTNITRNHIDDHGSWEAYIEAKLRLPRAALAGGGDAIVSGSDPVTAGHIGALRALGGRLWVVGDSEEAAWVDGTGRLCIRRPGSAEILDLGHRSDLTLQGEHNLDNLLTALCAALAAGASEDDLRGAVRSFSGLSGRLEQVAQQDGVRWVYDIQATTAPATAAGIAAIAPQARRLILMVGGEDKGMDYSGMADAAAANKARILALRGSGTDAFLAALGPRCEVTHHENLDALIASAAGIAAPGDIVLLSPGCAFFHRNYIEAGKAFGRRVREFLAERES